jgi:hypothetical protein
MTVIFSIIVLNPFETKTVALVGLIVPEVTLTLKFLSVRVAEMPVMKSICLVLLVIVVFVNELKLIVWDAFCPGGIFSK